MQERRHEVKAHLCESAGAVEKRDHKELLRAIVDMGSLT